MTIDKFKALTVYANKLKDRLQSDLPKKHLHREKAYKNYLNNELKTVTTILDAMKLEGLK